LLPPLIQALRPHQWTKNLAVFVGLVFAANRREQVHLFDPTVLVPVATLFVAFCLASSCVYLLNDVADRREDAQHPVKRHRAIASGRVSVGLAVATAVVLAVAAVAIVWFVPQATPVRVGTVDLRPGPLVLAAYLTLNLAYTSFLKRVVIADVSCVALGFLIRVVSGPKVAGLVVSPWLILCTFFGAMFLACGKRRGELLLTDGTGGGRSVLARYSPQVLDLLVAIAGTATMLSYSIYTVAAETQAKVGSDHLLYTIPIVFYGLGRYLVLLYRRQRGEDPAAVLFGDRGMLAAIVAWLTAVVFVLRWWPT
jgi:4-hydroxybenzoate polyprenyltransferase